jgi:hypothetical protein
MYRHLSLGISVLLVGFPMLVVSAQNRTVDMPSSTVTIAGCLQHNDNSTTATVERTPLGAPAVPARGGPSGNLGELASTFLLADAMPVGPAAPAATTAPSGTAGTSGALQKKPAANGSSSEHAESMTYGLEGNDAELARYVGQRVEVTGTIAPPVTPGAGGGRTQAAPGPNANDPHVSSGSGPAQSGTERLHVTSIKSIAADCTTKSH